MDNLRNHGGDADSSLPHPAPRHPFLRAIARQLPISLAVVMGWLLGGWATQHIVRRWPMGDLPAFLVFCALALAGSLVMTTIVTAAMWPFIRTRPEPSDGGAP